MPRAKATPLAERDSNAAPKTPAKGKLNPDFNIASAPTPKFISKQVGKTVEETAAPLNGEEFRDVIQSLTNPQDAQEVVQAVIKKMNEPGRKRRREDDDPDPQATKNAIKKAKVDASGTKSKKADKDKDTDKYDVSSIHLDRENDGNVPIFDTCDDLRTKIRAYLRTSGNTQASLARHMTASQPTTNISGTQIKSFLEKKGPTSGATSGTFYAGYVFFEKLRIKQGKPKSKKRQEMEAEHSAHGVPTDTDGKHVHVLAHGSERPVMDKYGKHHLVPKSAFRRR